LGFCRRGMLAHQQASVPATTPQVNVAPQRAHADGDVAPDTRVVGS